MICERCDRVERLTEFRAVPAQCAQHDIEVFDDLSDQLVAIGQRVGQRGRLSEQRAYRLALALEGLNQLR